MGGRYLHGMFKGTAMGQPFEGASVSGYDNTKKKYFNVWVDSMSTGGKLKVRTKREPTDILVEIRDNGAGIPASVRSRIFEPFFTTKPVGEGTGLGLDTVARIVRKHRGNVRFESKPGDTCFQVRLPLP